MVKERHRPTQIVAGVGALALLATVSACGASTSGALGGSGPPTSATTSSTTGSAPVEVHPPGDIPDNQAFVASAGVGYRVSVPEGWARTTRGAARVFTDKYNSISIASNRSATPPTPATARTSLPSLRRTTIGYRPGTITTVRRSAGTAVLITYGALSPVNPVTGKVARLAVERYAFWHAGRQVVLTLAAPVGSDNVDPWRKVTDSLTWTSAR